MSNESSPDSRIPVVFDDGIVEYLPVDTVVTFPRGKHHRALGSYTRAIDTPQHPTPFCLRDDSIFLPDGRRARIEGWKDEALRLRSAMLATAKGFADFETAFESAQKYLHNYEHWTADEWDPIEKARTVTWTALDAVKGAGPTVVPGGSS